MVETLAVYVLVAAAAAWTVWRIVLPARVRRRLKARFGKGGGDRCDRCGS